MENNGANPTEGGNSGASNQTQSASSSGPEALPSYSSRNPGSASPAAMSLQGMYEPHKYGSNNHDAYQQQQQHSGFQLSAFHSNPSERMEEGDCSGQQRVSRMLVNQHQNRVVAIQ